eukprot:gene6094-7059_t
MFKFLAIALTIAFVVTAVNGNAGFAKPLPRNRCSEKSPDGCGMTSACIFRESTKVNAIYYNASYSIAIYQKDAHSSTNSSNTYTVQYFPDHGDTGFQVLTFNQNDMNNSKSTYAVEIPALNTFDHLSENLEWDAEGNSYGYLQLTFDTRSGGGAAYYSCADVRLQLKKVQAPKATTAISLDGSITVIDPTDGNALGNAAVSSAEGTLLVDALVDGADPNKAGSGDIGEHDFSGGKKKKNSATKISSSGFIFASIISSFLLAYIL